jgi:hypothetical protein
MIHNLIFILIAIGIADSCDSCQYLNFNFSCGSIIYQLDTHPYLCCNSKWLKCLGTIEPLCPLCEFYTETIDDEQDPINRDPINRDPIDRESNDCEQYPLDRESYDYEQDPLDRETPFYDEYTEESFDTMEERMEELLDDKRELFDTMAKRMEEQLEKLFNTDVIYTTIFGSFDRDYKFTKDGILYSNYIYTAVPTIFGYGLGPRVHSSELSVGLTVFWPIHETAIGIFKVYHHNVTADHDNCCWSIQLGTSCEAKYCCGSTCCC